MHLAAALVLACLCAVDAQGYRSKWLTEMSPSKTWAPDWMSESNSDASYILQEPKKRVSPTIFPKSNPLVNAWENQESYDLASPTDARDHELPFSSQVIPQPIGWVAPAYNWSLADFETATDIISSHFTQDAFDDKDSQKFRYIVIVTVIHGLAEEVARNGMKSYWDGYTTLVRTFIEDAVMNTQMSAIQLTCVMNIAKKFITNVKAIINNPTVKFVCRSQPFSCDAAIYTAIHVYNNKKIEHEADALLSLGNAARTFLHSYSKVFEAMSAQNAYLYLMKSKNELADLVKVSAAARVELKKYVGLDCILNNP